MQSDIKVMTVTVLLYARWQVHGVESQLWQGSGGSRRKSLSSRRRRNRNCRSSKRSRSFWRLRREKK